VARKQEPVDELPETLPDQVERQVRRRGAVASRQLTKVKLTRDAQQRLYEALAQRGLEWTGKHVRVPLAEQVSALLDDKGHLPFQTLKRRVKGATNVTELRKTVGALHDRDEARFVMEGRKEIVARPSGAILSADALSRLNEASEQLAKLLRTARPRKGRPSPTLWRKDVTAALARLMVDGSREPAAPRTAGGDGNTSEREAVLGAIDRLEGKDGPLVFVPDVAREVSGRVAAAAVRQALLDAAFAGELELRPESGVGTLSAADAALCPRGPGGTVLSYARRLPQR